MANREILFRAWDLERKIYRNVGLWDNSMPSNWQKFYEIEQFTGLTDKNGKKIFEGDIVIANCAPSGHDKRHIKNRKCVVQFSEIKHGWDCLIIDFEKGAKWVTGYMSWGQNGNYLEVIGNIHETPESNG